MVVPLYFFMCIAGRRQVFEKPKYEEHAIPKHLGPERFGLGWVMKEFYAPLLEGGNGILPVREAAMTSVEKATAFASVTAPGRPLESAHLRALAAVALGSLPTDEHEARIEMLDVSTTTQDKLPLGEAVSLVLAVDPDLDVDAARDRIKSVSELGDPPAGGAVDDL